MYTLRIIEETRENENVPFEQVIENFEIGSSYSVIKKGCSKEFDSILEDYPDANKEKISALLCVERRDERGNVFFLFQKTAERPLKGCKT